MPTGSTPRDIPPGVPFARSLPDLISSIGRRPESDYSLAAIDKTSLVAASEVSSWALACVNVGSSCDGWSVLLSSYCSLAAMATSDCLAFSRLYTLPRPAVHLVPVDWVPEKHSGGCRNGVSGDCARLWLIRALPPP